MQPKPVIRRRPRIAAAFNDRYIYVNRMRVGIGNRKDALPFGNGIHLDVVIESADDFCRTHGRVRRLDAERTAIPVFSNAIRPGGSGFPFASVVYSVSDKPG